MLCALVRHTGIGVGTGPLALELKVQVEQELKWERTHHPHVQVSSGTHIADTKAVKHVSRNLALAPKRGVPAASLVSRWNDTLVG